MKIVNIKSFYKNYSVFKKDKIFFKNDKNIFYIVDKKIFDIFLSRKLRSHNKIIINSNEDAKTYEKVGVTIKKLIMKGIRKNSLLIAIGGGVIQDISAFTASIIFRGIEWEFYPTTLIAQGDSCIGSKTSINFSNAKNQIGNFYPPKKVVIHTKFLQSLKQKDIYSGFGELAHYFLLSNKKNWNFYKKNLKIYKNYKNVDCLKKLIFISLKIKKKFIEKDEFDKKERLLLNYGHSFGHALEKYTNHNIPHGMAVAHGMNIANFMSMKLNFMKLKEFKEIESTLKNIVNLKKIKNLQIEKFVSILKKDKKNSQNSFRFILSKGLGKMFVKEIKSETFVKKTLEDYKFYV